MNHNFPWLILFLPLLSAAIITLFTQRNRGLSAFISIGAIVAGFILSLVLLIQTGSGTVTSTNFSLNWLSVGSLEIEFVITIDALSKLMLLIVTGVGSAIHIYSWGYMHEDRCVSRY